MISRNRIFSLLPIPLKAGGNLNQLRFLEPTGGLKKNRGIRVNRFVRNRIFKIETIMKIYLQFQIQKGQFLCL